MPIFDDLAELFLCCLERKENEEKGLVCMKKGAPGPHREITLFPKI
jgi:hypothetical protein